MRKDNKVHTDMRSSDSSPDGSKHKSDCFELRTGGSVYLIVERMTCGRLPENGEPAIVSNGCGKRYWCRRARLLAASWLELDAFDWVDGFGWDKLPVKRRETLEAIDVAMKGVGL